MTWPSDIRMLLCLITHLILCQYSLLAFSLKLQLLCVSLRVYHCTFACVCLCECLFLSAWRVSVSWKVLILGSLFNAKDTSCVFQSSPAGTPQGPSTKWWGWHWELERQFRLWRAAITTAPWEAPSSFHYNLKWKTLADDIEPLKTTLSFIEAT